MTTGPLGFCILVVVVLVALASATGDIPGAASCDSRIVIAVDVSGSMSTTLVGENKVALLRGQLMQSIEHDLASRTGLCTALVQFATEARLVVNYTDNVQYVVDAIAAMHFELAHPDYYTNWEAALATMLALQPSVGYLITDGPPSTRIGCNAQPCDDYVANVAAAKLASEALFAKGVRVVAIGVGKQIGNEALAAVSGPCLGGLGCQLDQDYMHIYLNASQPSAKLGLQLGGHSAASTDSATTEAEDTTTTAAAASTEPAVLSQAEPDTTTTAATIETTTEAATTTEEATTTTTTTAAAVTTTEYHNGVPQKQVEKFRAYGSYAEAFSDYANFISSNPRYASVVQQGQGAPAAAHALQRAGYATDPNYADKLVKVMNQINTLGG